jgi:hypothetical protein
MHTDLGITMQVNLNEQAITKTIYSASKIAQQARIYSASTIA